MEDLPLFPTQNEQFSASGMYFKDEESDSFLDDSVSALFNSKQDLQMLFDWEDHVGFQDSFVEEDFKYNLDLKSELPDLSSPILTNALTSPVPIKVEQDIKQYSNGGDKILFPGDVEPLQISSSLQTDNVLKRITQARSVLINGEKEIFGKNIIGLHSLNEIKSSPGENCQITSTVINGKKYKIIIKPKSSAKTKPQKNHGEATVKELDLKDELISELQNGDYDVLENDDVLDPWMLPGLGSHEEGEEVESEPPASPPEPEPPRVPPLRIKIPKKSKKVKSKKEMHQNLFKFEKSEETDDKLTRKSLLRNSVVVKSSDRSRSQSSSSTVAKFTIPEISGDSVQLDHDYCSLKGNEIEDENRKCKLETGLVEKNPRKDSGLESNEVSDASEEGTNNDFPDSSSALSENSPSPSPSIPILSAPILAQQLTSKLREERRRSKNHSNVTKMAAALFRAANAVTSGQTSAAFSNHDAPTSLLPTLTCDNLTNHNDTSTLPEQPDQPIVERPKKKLKLEEYLSRRHDKDDNIDFCEIPKEESKTNENITTNAAVSNEETNGLLSIDEIKKEAVFENEMNEDVSKDYDGQIKSEISLEKEVKMEISDKSEEKRSSPKRVNRRSSSSSNSSHRYIRRKASSRNRRGRSISRDRRRNCWSPSRRSSSRDSSSSSGDYPNRRTSFNSLRHRRRSRSRSRSLYRSCSRDKSRSRSFGGRRRPAALSRQGRRSRSPVHQQREKTREIEERRVVYVGRIPEGTTNQQLRQRFSLFGPIADISVHFRERADNYGFVTFMYKDDAYRAVEHGNDNPALPRYDLCFGGRRTFCKQRYSDLDGMPTSYSGFKDVPVVRTRDDSFDHLLKQAKKKLNSRKEVT